MRYIIGIGIVIISLSIGFWQSASQAWSVAELKTIQSLSLDTLRPLPPNRTNLVADTSLAQTMGHQLFFDTRLSLNGLVSCATCHQPQYRFTDQKKVSTAIGTSKRNAPSLVGVAYSPWFYWDGRKDSLWSQALSPLEDEAEHGGHRLFYAQFMLADEIYRRQYSLLFGTPPDLTDLYRFEKTSGDPKQPDWQSRWSQMPKREQRVINQIFSNMGKVIAAYERLLQPGPSRFDDYANALTKDNESGFVDYLTAWELYGLRIFIGKGNCTQCHNGPLLTNNSFHNTGNLPLPGTTPDLGRRSAVRSIQADPFNCRGAYSDNSEACDELSFMQTGKETIGAIRTPSLRNLSLTAPYGHAGQYPDLASIIRHYDIAPQALVGHNEAKPLGLWPWERQALEAFLLTLSAPPTTAEKWLSPPAQ